MHEQIVAYTGSLSAFFCDQIYQCVQIRRIAPLVAFHLSRLRIQSVHTLLATWMREYVASLDQQDLALGAPNTDVAGGI